MYENSKVLAKNFGKDILKKKFVLQKTTRKKY
jgi:hypothetical protein